MESFESNPASDDVTNSDPQSLSCKYSTWLLNEILSLLLSSTRTPHGACSVDNSRR